MLKTQRKGNVARNVRLGNGRWHVHLFVKEKHDA